MKHYKYTFFAFLFLFSSASIFSENNTKNGAQSVGTINYNARTHLDKRSKEIAGKMIDIVFSNRKRPKKNIKR